VDLRCPGKKHAVVVEPSTGVVEIKCDSQVCTRRPRRVILHRWNLATGELKETISYRDPQLNSSHNFRRRPQ
jgi:hypothetical protein